MMSLALATGETSGGQRNNRPSPLPSCLRSDDTLTLEHSTVLCDLPYHPNIPSNSTILPPSRSARRSLPPTVPVHFLDHVAIASSRNVLQLALPDR